MDESLEPPSVDELTRRLRIDTHESVRERLQTYRQAEPERQKELLRALQSIADEQSSVLSPFVPDFVPFLTDDERSVRLTTSKLFVALSKSNPDAVVDIVDAVADRLADDEEFYYVRARSAEALGYLASEYPEEVVTPERLADLRIGLSFDESEVKEKLAKALAYVALGDPRRLRHQVPDLVEHLDDENELVRYHLSTAIVAVGCEHPDALSEGVDEFSTRLDDECPHVRGRAAEALGLLVRTARETPLFPVERLHAVIEDTEEPFAIERARFALAGVEGETPKTDRYDAIGSVELIRERTDEVVEEIASPEGECRNCGLALPESGPPMCPRCGAPY